MKTSWCVGVNENTKMVKFTMAVNFHCLWFALLAASFSDAYILSRVNDGTLLHALGKARISSKQLSCKQERTLPWLHSIVAQEGPSMASVQKSEGGKGSVLIAG
jgi:hypothetical protein